MYKGKYHEGTDKADPSTWKTRLRCALNKSTDFQEVPERSQLDISEPYKVYQIVSDGARDAGTAPTPAACSAPGLTPGAVPPAGPVSRGHRHPGPFLPAPLPPRSSSSTMPWAVLGQSPSQGCVLAARCGSGLGLLSLGSPHLPGGRSRCLWGSGFFFPRSPQRTMVARSPQPARTRR